MPGPGPQQAGWRVDSTAFDKRKKEEELGLRGCPQCYSKTYVKHKIGDTCPNCGGVIGVHFFFQSQHQVERDGSGKWIRCTSEETCKKMAEKGYVVKKVVEPPKIAQRVSER